MPLHTEQLNALHSHLTELAVAARQMLAVLMEEYDTLYAGDIPLPDLLNRMNVRNRLFSRIMSNQMTDPTYSRKGQMDEGRQGILGKA